MPLTGQPPSYSRGYDYEQHSISQPNVPQPGDKLNQDFDDIAVAVNDGNAALDAITNPDGTLKDGIVTKAKIDPATYDQIVDDASADLQPFVSQAQAAATAASNSANAAESAAVDAETAAQDASSWATSTAQVANTALAAQATAVGSAADSKMYADRAANDRSTAQDAMSVSLDWSEQSFKWAEYLAGPVMPAPPGWPEAIDDGMWSAKWWAVRAREIVGAWGGLYLGAFPGAPPINASAPWPPGSLYYDTDLGQMFVWNGQQWTPLVQPTATVTGQYVYIATAGQQDFSGADAKGRTPSVNVNKPQPNDVHVNGVKLVEDPGGDFAVNNATSVLHINQPLTVGSVVQWDQIVHPSLLAPGSVVAFKVINVDLDPVTNNPGEFDGVRVTFPLRYVDPKDGLTKPCAPSDGVQLQLSLDGVVQEFSIDYHTTASDITFQEAPPAGMKFWAVWYQPGLSP
jgi:hypothetical protein